MLVKLKNKNGLACVPGAWDSVERSPYEQPHLFGSVKLLGHTGVPTFFSAMLMAQLVKNLPAMQETWVRSLCREDPLEKEMATTPVFLPRESHGQRSLGGYSPRGCKESDMTE